MESSSPSRGDPSTQFADMVRDIRAGNVAAIGKFVATYEPFIRRTIRFRLAKSPLRPVADSVDVCQSVMSSFLIRLTAGEYELTCDEDLRKLLGAIANHKFLALLRREFAEKRDRRQMVPLGKVDEIVDARQVEPDRAIGHAELLARFESLLSLDERRLYDLRRQGLAWDSIAAQSGESEVVLRKRLSRAIKRISVDVGIDVAEE